MKLYGSRESVKLFHRIPEGVGGNMSVLEMELTRESEIPKLSHLQVPPVLDSSGCRARDEGNDSLLGEGLIA